MIDTHCHIDLYPNPVEILKHCIKNNVTVLAMTNLPSHFEIGITHIKSYKNIRLSLGLHPQYAERYENEYPIFKKNLNKTSYIGEIGLDFSKEYLHTKDIQIKYFKQILNEVKGQSKILNLHSRKAEKEVFNLLKDYSIKNAIFHWYSGPLQLIESIANSGYFFSINLAMLRSEKGKEIIQHIPKANILTETDGPFVEHLGKIVKPADVKYIYVHLAKMWNISEAQATKIIKDNFSQLIRQLNSKGQ